MKPSALTIAPFPAPQLLQFLVKIRRSRHFSTTVKFYHSAVVSSTLIRRRSSPVLHLNYIYCFDIISNLQVIDASIIQNESISRGKRSPTTHGVNFPEKTLP
ncbi:hypothetical protein [Oxynema aestuarii]|uniref:Uncharacterized protein n=1 Tax=Oxynema aestuarii AP17 TaxID=2064643 RepID=A0A6H1TY56_9CYAN|nr:hypothetical protein [Oxynema aestuarii]QIZ70850.1 hypothetical protein HCG48_09855 [Oxynema aestuarii AP17]